jgi:hypothetical protein
VLRKVPPQALLHAAPQAFSLSAAAAALDGLASLALAFACIFSMPATTAMYSSLVAHSKEVAISDADIEPEHPALEALQSFPFPESCNLEPLALLFLFGNGRVV